MSNFTSTGARVAPLADVLPRHLSECLGLAFLVLALLLAGPHAAMAHGFKVGDLEIGHPWSRATPAGARVAGGYFTITNTGDTPDRLVSISSDIAARSELHEMSAKDGVMTMRPLEGGLEIPAGKTVEVAPGGYHLMFTDLKRQPKQGETFSAVLTYEKAGAVTVEFAVEGLGATGGMDDH